MSKRIRLSRQSSSTNSDRDDEESNYSSITNDTYGTIKAFPLHERTQTEQIRHELTADWTKDITPPITTRTIVDNSRKNMTGALTPLSVPVNATTEKRLEEVIDILNEATNTTKTSRDKTNKNIQDNNEYEFRDKTLRTPLAHLAQILVINGIRPANESLERMKAIIKERGPAAAAQQTQKTRK